MGLVKEKKKRLGEGKKVISLFLLLDQPKVTLHRLAPKLTCAQLLLRFAPPEPRCKTTMFSSANR